MAKGSLPMSGAWKRSSESLVSAFERAVDVLEGIEARKMFGYPCRFVDGQMFTGLFQENMILRLSEEDRREFLSIPGAAQFEPTPGRVMREYMVVPPDMLESEREIRPWLTRSYDYARSLPPKPPRKPRGTAAKKIRKS